jgi:DNA polymerase-1
MTKRSTTPEKRERIVLLDTHAIIHRAYHALPDFTSPAGEPTGALYGLTAFLLKVVQELHPDHIVAAFDLPQPTHRHEAYAEYKATREKADDALIAQLVRSRNLLDALGVPRLEVPGYEADDILGTLAATLGKKKDTEVIIASGDMDTLQLVQGDTVRVYTLKKGINDTVIYDEDAVKARYGFGPELVADYKGLRGDPSDNIPGIRGIGEKTATQLITTFGSIDAIYETLEKHPERFTEAGIKPRVVELVREGEDEARFSKELATIRRDTPVTLPSFAKPWSEGVDLPRALGMFSELGFRSLAARLKTIVGGSDVEVQPHTEEQSVDERDEQKIAIALWLLRSDITNPTREDMLEYTGTQSFDAARAKILKELHDAGLTRVYEDIELPLIPVVERMEQRGILLDLPYLQTLSRRYHTDLDAIAKRIYEAAGGEFNLNSPRQLGEVLFEKLGIGDGKGKRTATGQRSTREDELKKFSEKHPVVADILEYRELQKLLSTYIDNLPTMVDSEGRLHAHFSQTGTTTGRMSSQSPNMQNIPIKSSRGAAIRKAIIAPPGFVLLAADYSQIELRIAAFLSQDEKLIEYFKEGQDIHTAVAAQVFNVPPEMVDKEMRRRAKAINFGILYGMGANALAVATGTSRAEAQTYLVEYFKRFSGIARYVESVKAEVHSRGYTETWFGRRRYFEGIRSPLPHIVAAAERMALNAPIQGTQSDIIKIAMARIDTALREAGLANDVFLTSQVHDELMYEVRAETAPAAVALVRTTMEQVLPLKETRGVPLKVDVGTGSNWGEMEKQ